MGGDTAVAGLIFTNWYFASLHDTVTFCATRDTYPACSYLKPANGKISQFDDLPAEKSDIGADEVPNNRKLG